MLYEVYWIGKPFREGFWTYTWIVILHVEWIIQFAVHVQILCGTAEILVLLLLYKHQFHIHYGYTGLFKMIVRVLTTCSAQYTSDSNTCVFYLIEQHSMFLLYTALYVHTLWLYRVIQNGCRCFNNLSCTINLRYQLYAFLFNRTTLQVFVTYCSICAPFVILQGYSKWLSGF